MADKKNQHYVPRVYLRPWSFNGEGKAIALFNIERRITIPSAPLKNQCSSNFFYGRDLVLEDWLADVEGDYGTLMSKLKSLGGQELSDALDFLREFSYLLYVRTERSVEQDMTFMDDMAKAIYRGEPQVLPERERTVKEAIIRWSETRHILSDLRAVLVSNATSVPFVTCDDPAVLTNRLSLQKHKMDSIGIATSGTILFLPLAPDLAVLYYDSDVYTLPGRKGLRIEVSTAGDVHALNDLQVLKARLNLYFEQAPVPNYFEDALARLGGRRLSSEHRLTPMVPIEGKPNAFRSATDEEAASATRFMLGVERVGFRPERWPSFLKFKRTASGYTDGSAMGYLRRAEAFRRGLGSSHKTKVSRRPF